MLHQGGRKNTLVSPGGKACHSDVYQCLLATKPEQCFFLFLSFASYQCMQKCSCWFLIGLQARVKSYLLLQLFLTPSDIFCAISGFDDADHARWICVRMRMSLNVCVCARTHMHLYTTCTHTRAVRARARAYVYSMMSLFPARDVEQRRSPPIRSTIRSVGHLIQV